MATLKSTEYGLAVESGHMARALGAQTAALALERQIGAHSMAVRSLVNLSDCYLRMRDYGHAAASAINHQNGLAAARINLGQAYLAIGRLAEGRRSFEAGLAKRPDAV